MPSLDILASLLSVSKISSDISPGVSDLGLIHSFLGTTHTTAKCFLRRNNELPQEHYLCELGNKSEKCNAVSRALNGGRSNENVADKGLLIAVFRHIIVVTPELCSCVLTVSRVNR
jgi:hypothetical protein